MDRITGIIDIDIESIAEGIVNTDSIDIEIIEGIGEGICIQEEAILHKELNAIEMNKKRAKFQRNKKARGYSPDWVLRNRIERHLRNKQNVEECAVTDKCVKAYTYGS